MLIFKTICTTHTFFAQKFTLNWARETKKNRKNFVPMLALIDQKCTFILLLLGLIVKVSGFLRPEGKARSD